MVHVIEVAFAARGDRYAGFDHGLPRRGLIPHALDDLGLRANEANASARADGREFGVLGQKAVARMNGVAACFYRQVHQAVGVEIAPEGVVSNEVGLIGALHVKCIAIRFRINGDGTDIHFRAGANEADRDFTAVGNQYLLQHERRPFPERAPGHSIDECLIHQNAKGAS